MSTSQLLHYTSSDANGPGLMPGGTSGGSLLTVLDACLVTGYSPNGAAGWSKPFANLSSIGCYRQGAGAGLNLVVNDAGPNGSATYEEAWATGWESLAGTQAAALASPVGAGTGQFPVPSQVGSDTTGNKGNVVWRKSKTADAVGRQWQIWADASTFYIFISTGDTTGKYYCGMFGDIYSLKGASDLYRCQIVGRGLENSAATTANYDTFDAVTVGAGGSTITSAYIGTASLGHFMPRTWGGGGTSIQVSKICDASVIAINQVGQAISVFNGVMPAVNGPDNSYYLAPLRVVEPTTGTIRGRWRGFYQICNSASGFSDGQTFQGSGDYAGKSFMVVSTGPVGSIFAMETSATVETN